MTIFLSFQIIFTIIKEYDQLLSFYNQIMSFYKILIKHEGVYNEIQKVNFELINFLHLLRIVINICP